MDMTSPYSNLVFVSHAIGWRSEVWLWRQLVGFRQVSPHVLTWDYTDRAAFPLGEIPIHILGFPPEPENGKGFVKWLHRLRCLGVRNFLASVGAEKKAITAHLNAIKPGVILAQFGFMGLRILPVARALGIPVVVHFHGLDISSSLANRWYRWSLLRHLQDFSGIVVVGAHQKAWMLAHGVPADKIHLIACGVPTDEFVPKENWDSDAIRFLAVSRLVEKKGLVYTINAFRTVVDRLPTAQLHIVGDGPLRGDLEGLAGRLGLGKNIFFHGSVGGDVVREEMQRADVFVQHSIVASTGDSEGSPVVIAEAAASCLPVIATRSPGIIDQVIDGETGFLVPQKDSDAMAQRMLALSGDADLRETMGRAGRERMVHLYDTPRQIAKLEEVLLSVVDSSPGVDSAGFC